MFNNYPYTNFHELNLAYFIQQFQQIFQQWHELYTTMQEWKENTTQELEAWKDAQEAAMAAWEAAVLSDLNEWKNTTEDDISDWEQSVLDDLNQWRQAFDELFESIQEDAAQAAIDAQTASEKATLASNYANAAIASAELAQSFVGAPLVASTVSEMTDHDRIYVYVGSESGYTSGNWYYYNGSSWVSGGIYNSAAVQTDTTLSIAGMAADAAATGVVKTVAYDSLARFDPSWTRNGLNVTTGATTDSTTRIASSFLSVPVRIVPAFGYSFTLLQYSSSGSYLGVWNGTEFRIGAATNIWRTDEIILPTIVANYDSYTYRIALRRNDNTNVDVSDATNIDIYYYTDKTFSIPNKSADAAETGRFIGNVRQLDGLGYDVLYNVFKYQTELNVSPLLWKQGAWRENGEELDYMTNRIRTGLIPRKVFDSMTVGTSTGYEWNAVYFDLNKSPLNISTGWRSDTLSIENPLCEFLGINLRNASDPDANISVSEYSALHINVIHGSNFGSPQTKWYVLGDSISAGYYSMTQSMADAAGITLTYISPVTTEQGETTGAVWDSSLNHNYWGYINKWYLKRELEGKAHPAQGYYKKSSNNQSGVDVVKNTDFSDAGLITVAWGFNDWHYEQPRGNHNLIDNTIKFPTSSFDTSRITTINHAIWYCLGMLIQKAPQAKILVQTPMNGWTYGGDFDTNWSINYSLPNSGTLKNIHDDIIYWCEYYGLQYIDLTYNNSIVNRVNIKDVMIDGSHPSDVGHQQLARSIWTAIGY